MKNPRPSADGPVSESIACSGCGIKPTMFPRSLEIPAMRFRDPFGFSPTYLAKKAKAKEVLLVGCDVYRPAAINQLQVVGEQIGVEVYAEEENKNPQKNYEARLVFLHCPKRRLLLLERTAVSSDLNGSRVIKRQIWECKHFRKHVCLRVCVRKTINSNHLLQHATETSAGLVRG